MINATDNAHANTKSLIRELSDAKEARTKEAGWLFYDSHALFQGQEEVIIQHQGQSYRLSQTKQGKLILTK